MRQVDPWVARWFAEWQAGGNEFDKALKSTGNPNKKVNRCLENGHRFSLHFKLYVLQFLTQPFKNPDNTCFLGTAGLLPCWESSSASAFSETSAQCRGSHGDYFIWLVSQRTAATVRLWLCYVLPKEEESRTLLWKQSFSLHWMRRTTVILWQWILWRLSKPRLLQTQFYVPQVEIYSFTKLCKFPLAQRHFFLRSKPLPITAHYLWLYQIKQIYQGNTWAGKFRGGPARHSYWFLSSLVLHRRGESSTCCTLTR